MENEFIYIASAFLVLFCLTIILLLVSIKRGKKIKEQASLLKRRDDSVERYNALEKTLEQTKKEAQDNYFALEERLKNVESELDHKANNLIQTAEKS